MATLFQPHRRRFSGILLLVLCIVCVFCQPDNQDVVPTAWIDGKRISIRDTFPSIEWHDTRYYVLNEEKHMWYIEDFLNATIAQESKDFCQERFQPSPIRDKDSQILATTEGSSNTQIRTSESCVLFPAGKYRGHPRYEKDIKPDPQHAKVVREVDVAWEISERAADWLGLSSAHQVESLQVVRYTSPEAEYRTHHDHGGFYGKTTELRPYTVLVFLNNVASGGFTSFPKLQTKIQPRGGDAIVWSNELQDGSADPDMMHAGEPPGREGIEKYALNVWIMRQGETGMNDAWRVDADGDKQEL